MSTITCPDCGRENRREAKFCRYCRADLSPTRTAPPVAGERAEPPQPKVDVISGVVETVKRLVRRPETSPAPSPSTVSGSEQPAAAPSQPAPAKETEPLGRLISLQPGSILYHPQDAQRKYSIVTARELERSIYYDALDLTCSACQRTYEVVPPHGLCPQCQAPLGVVLIHERRLPPSSLHPESELEQLIELSTNHAHILPHRDIVQYQEHIYTVAEHPGRWGVLVRGRRQRSPDEALISTAQVGQALVYLHENGFAHFEVGGASIESLVVVGGGRDVKLADMSTCVPLSSDDSQAVRARINRDIAFLGRLLFYLATNRELSRTSIKYAPPALHTFIERATQEQYASVQDMLTDFSLLPPAPTQSRALKPAHGLATHPGRQHVRNEDAVVTFTFDKQQDGGAVPIGFFLVADGMGGHEAGDIASGTVNEIVTDWVINASVLPDLRKVTDRLKGKSVPGELLIEAIEQTNEALYHQAQATGTNMGSTVTTALIIGNMATIANVGDSRTYLLRDGRLEQITQDHSLVARLVEAGVIGPEDVRSHPQRNRIYRGLGQKLKMEVDIFTRRLQVGDVLVLCSDGLWEMVTDDEIQRIIEGTRSPQKACDALVEAANRAGGEDNIAVIVVEME